MAKLHALPVKSSVALIILIGLCLLFSPLADGQTGVCYGILGSNLPPPTEMVSLCQQHGIRSVRIYDPNPEILQALSGSQISVMVGIPNQEIPAIAQNPVAAQEWVQNNIRRFPGVSFKYIVVGNEINPSDPAFAPYVAPAMNNIFSAVSGTSIKVSTSISSALLGQSYPPSTGAFRPDVEGFIGPIINFLKAQNSPLLANTYPYLAYAGDPTHVSLEYALFTSPVPVVIDGPYQYQNLFDAILDAFHVALERYGAQDLDVVVSETGWPTDGGAATTVENAAIYNNRLLSHVAGGTPRRPGKYIEVYIFDLMDEDQKSPEFEKHWGVFYPNKQLKYPISF
ncbi:lichenase-like [Henckelia pumila]|uniref:lichenase-like n=1 Tax=Henckelia pumila TaxID=405737 RepID=UPI003C6E63A3